MHEQTRGARAIKTHGSRAVAQKENLLTAHVLFHSGQKVIFIGIEFHENQREYHSY